MCNLTWTKFIESRVIFFDNKRNVFSFSERNVAIKRLNFFVRGDSVDEDGIHIAFCNFL